MMLDTLGREVSFEDIEARYRGDDPLSWFLEARDRNDAEVRPLLIEGGLQVTENLESGDGPWAILVEGDLVTTGDLEVQATSEGISCLIVTGSVRARNLDYSGGAQVVVGGDLTASGIITGSGGTDGAMLGVGGALTARAVLLDSHTPIWAKAGTPRSVPEAFHTLLVGGTGWRGLEPDIDVGAVEQHVRTFVPEVLSRGVLDLHRALEHARQGGGPFLPEVEQALRAKKGL